jgi:hypothetical protein
LVREVNMVIYMTAAEKQEIVDAARRVGVTTGEWMRTLALRESAHELRGTRWDGRQHLVAVTHYELIEGEAGSYGQLIWRLTLKCGHIVKRVSGHEAQPGQYGARMINGKLYVSVARKVACDICRDKCKTGL